MIVLAATCIIIYICVCARATGGLASIITKAGLALRLGSHDVSFSIESANKTGGVPYVARCRREQ